MKFRNTIKRHYESKLHSHLDSFEVLHWSSAEEQELRFSVFYQQLLKTGLLPANESALSVLDVGCGLADLYRYFKHRKENVDYTGVDITQGILEEAVRRNPGVNVLWADVFHDNCPFASNSFNVVFCSGVFNLNLGNNDEFVPKALIKLFNLSNQIIVVNLLHKRAKQKYPECWYTNPEFILNSLPENMQDACLIDDYLEKDFTLVFNKNLA